MTGLIFFLGFWFGGMFMMTANVQAGKLMSIDIPQNQWKYIIFWPWAAVKGLLVLAGRYDE